MVYKVLSIATRVAFGLVCAAFAVCLVYTLATPQVQAGLQQIRQGVDGMVDSAMDSMDSDWGVDLSGLADGAAQAVSGVVGVATAGGSADSQESPTAPENAYRTWQNTMGDPTGKVLGQTGVTREMIEGIAAGSASAFTAFTGLDSSILGGLAAAASSYSLAASSCVVSPDLPEAVRADLLQACAYAQDYAAAVVGMVEVADGARGGDAASSETLTSCADAAVRALSLYESSVASAESGLEG